MAFDSLAFRAQFPLFLHPDNAELIYLDNAATSQKPEAVIEAISRYYRTNNANAHRASHRLGRASTEIIENTRKALALHVNAAHSSEIVFTRGSTEAINLLAYCLGEQIQSGDEILITRAEHHANLIPWQRLAQQKQLKLVFLPSVNGTPDFSRLPEFITDKTQLFACTAASNVLGVCSPLARIKEVLTKHKIPWLLDAAQLLAHGPVDVQAIGCDFLVASAHKFYGPSGIGFLYSKKEWLERFSPWQSGGQMVTTVTLQHSDYQAAPLKFEAGTPSLAEIAGLRACLVFWAGLDLEGLRAYEQNLLNTLYQGLESIDSIKIISPQQNNLGVVSFSVDGVHGSDLALWLDEYDIAVRTGQHCAAPLLADLGVEECVRVSLCAYNTVAEIEKFLSLLQNAINVLTESSSLALPLTDSVGEVSPATRFDFVLPDLSACNLEQLKNQKAWQQRYRMLMQWAKVISAQPELRQKKYKITGCEANTWLACKAEGGHCLIVLDSEANVVKGLGVLLLLHLQNKTPEQILNWQLKSLLEEYNLDRHLSESRVNGINALWQAIRAEAASF